MPQVKVGAAPKSVSFALQRLTNITVGKPEHVGLIAKNGGDEIFEYPWVVKPPVYFKSIEDLIEKMPGSIILPAGEKLKERQALLDQLFRS